MAFDIDLNPNQVKKAYPKEGGWSLTQFPPTAIADLVISEGATIAMMTWTAITDANYIEVWRRDVTAAGAFGLVATRPSDTSGYIDHDLIPENEYEWRLEAINNQGPTPSNAVTRPMQANTQTQVTIAGSGFGLEPNVIFYRTFEEGVDGEQMQLTAPAGEIGDFVSGSMTYGSVNGHKCLMGFDSLTSRSASFEFPALSAAEDNAVQSFNWFTKQMTPPGRTFVGSDTVDLRKFSGVSDFKSIWMLGDVGGTNTNELPDIAPPQHGGGGNHYLWGNAINYSLRAFGSGGTDNYDFYDWDDWNSFNLIQDADPAAPKTGAREQVHHFSSNLVGGDKGTKTFTDTNTAPAYGGNYVGPDSACHYQIVNVNSYAIISEQKPELTQHAYGVMYLASSSPQGTANYKQMVFLGDGATLADCGQRKPKIADSWSDTSVTVSVNPDERLQFTHALVMRADNTTEAEAL